MASQIPNNVDWIDATSTSNLQFGGINGQMHSLVYLTTRLPAQVSDDLQAAGYEVFEALEPATSVVTDVPESEQDADVFMLPRKSLVALLP